MDSVINDFRKSSKSFRNLKFEHFDIFGQKLNFGINGRSTYRTKVGSILTLALIALMSYISYVFFSKYADKEKPTILYNEMRKNYGHPIYLQKDGFNFYVDAFNMYTNSFMSLESFNKHFYIDITHISRNKDVGAGFVSKNIKTIECAKLGWPNK